MRLAEAHTEITKADWREALHVAFGLGLSNLFNVEWLIENAERGEWDGLWW